jgi:asparagine synthase (glutamine-hydrolysing)
MAIFVLSRTDAPEDIGDSVERRLGPGAFKPLDTLPCGDWRLMLFGRTDTPTLSVYHGETPGEFGCAVGTFMYDGQIGPEAVRRAFSTFDDDQGLREDCFGHFALLLHRNGKTVLATDRLGAVKIYWNKDDGVLSNSFICALASTKAPRLARQEVYEYAWQGSVFGDRTFIEQIRTIPPASVAILDRSVRVTPIRTETEEPRETGRSDLSRVAAEQLSALRPVFKQYARHFPDRLRTALSGGYDSRLVLALLLEAGVRPELYVYGANDDPDVRVAKSTAQGLGLSIEVIDKTVASLPSVAGFAECIARDLVAFDGWKVDGIFDRGTDFTDRVQRVDDDFAVLNGSAGEIYRDFFHLPDRKLRMQEFVWSFYCRFDPRACTGEFQERDYVTGLAAKARATLATDDPQVGRSKIDRLYPLFRGRYWTGRDAAVNQLFGLALFPFLELSVIHESFRVPASLRRYGRLQAAMIRSVSPELASFPSVYGHSFAHPEPPLAVRLRELKSTIRPPRLRRFSYRWRYRRRRPFPPHLSDRFVNPIIGAERPYMSRYFRFDNIHHPDTYNRVCTMELICRQFGVMPA